MLLFMMHLVSFPRASGGDPELALGSAENGAVFPAQAGVILINLLLLQLSTRFPRASGGDPQALYDKETGKPFSPRKRG